MVISPTLLGWNTGPHLLQARLNVFALTGPYKVGSLANVGMNYWTFTPTLAYTYLDPTLGLDVSASLGIDLNTRNEKADYRSGALLHFDRAVTKNIGTTGFGVGVLFAFPTQIQDDRGVLADRLGGFRGQSFSLGLLARYNFKLGRMEVNSMLRWAPSSRPGTESPGTPSPSASPGGSDLCRSARPSPWRCCWRGVHRR